VAQRAALRGCLPRCKVAAAQTCLQSAGAVAHPLFVDHGADNQPTDVRDEILPSQKVLKLSTKKMIVRQLCPICPA
jgi:hypothetical protein